MGQLANSYVFLLMAGILVFGLRRVVRHAYCVRAGSSSETQPHKRQLVWGAACALMLVVLTVSVLNIPMVAALDSDINHLFEPFRAPWLVALFVQVTTLGSVICMGMLVVVTSALLWAFERRMLLMPLWIAFSGAELTTWVLKYWVDRTRPSSIHNIIEHNPSFPSGHATAATVVLGFVGYIVARELASPSHRIEVAFWTALSVVAICLSRLFLSLHYLSDVVSGLLVGSMWLMVGTWRVKQRMEKQGGAKLCS